MSMRSFLISLTIFLMVSSLNANVLSQVKMLDRFTKPLFPSFLLKEDSKYEEVKNKVVKRFNLPSAQLTHLSSSFGLQEYYSLNK